MASTLIQDTIIKALSKGPVHMNDFQNALVRAAGRRGAAYRRRDVLGSAQQTRNQMVEAGIIALDWDETGAVIYSLAAK